MEEPNTLTFSSQEKLERQERLENLKDKMLVWFRGLDGTTRLDILRQLEEQIKGNGQNEVAKELMEDIKKKENGGNGKNIMVGLYGENNPSPNPNLSEGGSFNSFAREGFKPEEDSPTPTEEEIITLEVEKIFQYEVMVGDSLWSILEGIYEKYSKINNEYSK